MLTSAMSIISRVTLPHPVSLSLSILSILRLFLRGIFLVEIFISIFHLRKNVLFFFIIIICFCKAKVLLKTTDIDDANP